jgi:CHAT domain-containing protein/tetratricopeptide (TPR) repeat protein
MVQKSSAPLARRLRINFHLGIFLAISFAAAPLIAQDRDRSRDGAAGDRAYAEGSRLRKEGTSASLPRAIEMYQEALAIRRALGDRSGEARALLQIGATYSDLKDSERAIDSLTQAAALLQTIGDRAGEAQALAAIGAVYGSLGDTLAAIEHRQRSLAVWRELGNREREAYTLTFIGSLRHSLGEPWKAIENWREALQIWRELGDQKGEAGVLYRLSTSYDNLGEKQKAIEHLRLALPLQRKLGDKDAIATTLYKLGLVYDSINERQIAAALFKEGLELRMAAGHPKGEGARLWTIANFYEGLRERQKSIDYYTRALALLEAAKNHAAVVSVLRSLGQAYGVIGEKRKALEYFNRAASMVALGGAGARNNHGRLLADTGKLLCEIGEYGQALEHLNRALTIIRNFNERFFEIYTLHWMARAERGRGNLQAARDRIAEAIDKIESLRPTVNSPELRASAFSRAQEIYEFEIDTLMQLRKLSPAGNYDAVALRANEQARAREMLAMLAESRAEIRQGVEPALLALERSLRERLDAQANRLTFLLNGKRDSEQIEAARRELDALQTEYQQAQAQIRRVSPRYAALNFPQPLSLREIQQQVLDADTLLLEYSLGEERSYLWAVTKDSMTSYELPGRGEIERASSRVYDLLTARNRWIRFETADEKHARVAKADDEYPRAAAALAQMVLGPVAERLAMKRLLIVSDGALQYVPFAALPAPSGERESGRAGERGIRRSSSFSLTSSLSRSFRPLIVDHEIVKLPSTSTLAVLRRELEGRTPAPKSVAVLADPVFDRNDERFKASFAVSPTASFGFSFARALTKPGGPAAAHANEMEAESDLVRSARDIGVDGFRLARLPFTRKEAQAILEMVPARERLAALDFAASQFTVFRPELAQYRYVHIATHGLLNSLRPELSGIVLSLVNERGADQDGFLRAHEVFDLRLPVEMVVLSGCQTGLGKEIKGEGLVGLTRGFMYAGASRVMVSLWEVNDQATSRLMARLYQGLLGKRRLSPAAALREAQVSIWRDKRWNAPYYWAAFTLQGEPR